MKIKMVRVMGMTLLSMMMVVMTACGSDTSSATQQVKEFRDYIEVKDEEGLFENAIAEEDTYWTEAQAHNVVQMLKDRKSTRLNSSHVSISYAVFCSKKKIT